jgi:CheY-like chemotaxis protein
VFIGVHLLSKPGDKPLKISFEVRDTGIGIAADKIDKLFKAFSQVDSSNTRKHDGTGLGLVISEKLIVMMGGTIQVRSVPGKGTTFVFCIQAEAGAPFVPANIHDLHTTSQPDAPKLQISGAQMLTTAFAKEYPLRILIAEDNPVNMMITTKILNKLGYYPGTAENGRKALDILQFEYFDLILMDLQMPEMDGLEATRMIRKSQLQQPCIIAMTANAMESDKLECVEAGMNDYLSKPINLDALVNMLKRWAGPVEAL